jgi:hypothetical protein
MAFYGAFWGEAFWNQAFQIARAGTPEPTPDVELLGGGGYVRPYQKYREEEYQRELIRKQQAELKRIDEELAEAERAKLALEAQRKAKRKAAAKAALIAQQEEEISRLRIQRAWLMQRIRNNQLALAFLLAAAQRRRHWLLLH